VSKTFPSSVVQEAYDCGIREFGENKVQELLSKKKKLPGDIRWHLIGHLQTNKVKQVLGEVVLIHSLDRLSLVREIERQAEKKGIRQVDCLIQVNISREESKFGVLPEAIGPLVEAVSRDSVIKILGLMGIAPFTEDEQQIRESFRMIRRVQDEMRSKFVFHKWDILSIGMTQDYCWAIEEGGNLIRIGSAVFGARSIQG